MLLTFYSYNKARELLTIVGSSLVVIPGMGTAQIRLAIVIAVAIT